MKKVGILGGTFDPIHHGHLITAQALMEIRNLESIIFIPCYISPHKTDGGNSSGLHRLNMVNLAIKDVPYFTCSPIEVERGGVSYTIDTLRELKKDYPEMELIIGMDNLEKFYTWKEPDELIKIAQLVVMERESSPREIPIDRYYEAAEFVKTPFIDIKATNIRQRVRQNLPIDFLVPKEIKEYIFRYNLYK
ncbi:MAG: nicotinate-nucleotide adenylyltransferase [Bacteroidota bacterium]|nr:nicotinate (nicotinamide) nucleotide adenylyltransferase [Ignavibacteria bacterium]MCU7499599.1 nicotinate (nicotinamide) nucleotide adenylyltransferase [Ignavibacteria bacterium]MCU7512998.1 nicotinate (nicotinamide) nucleotide adenylyltransferase [Ignavibacteria bacterium]MCU7524722.1 nicotinate (nicotinamide) nucleotide adenylyltransferase [Ignavibacteria bacterium]